MRIIDKNTDYYDYLQYIYPDDTFTFDRTDSYELTKDIVRSYLTIRARGQYGIRPREKTTPYEFLTMQIGSTFWLFLIAVQAEWKNGAVIVEDYSITLLKSWKNYDKPRELIKLSLIEFGWKYHIPQRLGIFFNDYEYDAIINSLDVLVHAVDTNDFSREKVIDKQIVYNGNTLVEKHIPLLKSCGISLLVMPEDIYNAFDEYFSMEKTAAESTVAEGTTNNDKIKNHGFDTKISFRGK
jgi:hypothetical protein